MNAKPFLIGGEWLSGATSASVRSPLDGRPVAKVSLADEASVEKAVAAAHEAFAVTRKQAPVERAQVLERIVDGLKKNAGELADLLIREAGKPRKLAEAEVVRAQQTFAFAAREALETRGELLAMDASPAGVGHQGMWRRFPLGVILGISPFNFPLNLVAHKVAPCIASGNTMILKPALKCPLSALRLGEILLEAGMTPGQVNVVPFDHAFVPGLLDDERVKMLTFTGSPGVGWELKARAGKKRVTLELGGNAAVIVHHDTDWQASIPMIAHGAFDYAGQSCISVQRILVQHKIYGEFRDAFVRFVKENIIAGDPDDPKVTIGPMIDKAARDRVLAWVDEAVVAGGKRLDDSVHDKNILRPMILEGVPHEAKISCEEAFGPVVLVESYDRFETALERVNDSRYGLQAGVFTRSNARALQAFETLDVGGVLIDQVPTFRVENMPYGGVKDSGFGREGIRFTMEEMTEIKSLIFHRG